MTISAHAIISGGSSGIGLSLACQLASEGWNLSLLARDEPKLRTAQNQISALRRDRAQDVRIYVADVANEIATTTAMQQAVEALGIPDLLIANAGITHPGNFVDLSPDVFRRIMEVNYFGTLHMLKAALPAMCERRSGHVVLVSSGAGLIGIHGYTAYAPSKFAIRGLAESLRSELKQHDIGISVVYPPDTDTPQLAEENELKSLATRRISANARILSAEAVAKAIIKGFKRNRFAITPGWEMTALAVLHSLIGPILQRYFDAIVAKAAKNDSSQPGQSF